MDLIRIRGLEMDCIVGVRPLEREREQRVHLDLAFGLDLSRAGRTGRIALTCDYSEIAEEVIAMLRFRRYHLIEMATEELSAMLLGTHPALEFVEIRLDKPAALDGKARAASVEVQRNRLAFPPKRQSTEFGSVETVLVTREAALQLLRVDPGRSVAEGAPEGETLSWLVTGELARGGTPLPRHEPEVGPRPGALTNAGSDPAVLFRCICPPGEDVREVDR
ncbi:MAG TPA: dihydroneopterin aldolase [Polyangiaceae bacterium]|nr:dihydroneopterin aldolase [Polyangiaceae bacterium]